MESYWWWRNISNDNIYFRIENGTVLARILRKQYEITNSNKKIALNI